MPNFSFIIRPGHLGKPEVGSGEDAEHGRNGHHQVEVADHKVSRMQHDVNRRLRQEESADPAAHEHRNEPEANSDAELIRSLEP